MPSAKQANKQRKRQKQALESGLFSQYLEAVKDQQKNCEDFFIHLKTLKIKGELIYLLKNTAPTLSSAFEHTFEFDKQWITKFNRTLAAESETINKNVLFANQSKQTTSYTKLLYFSLDIYNVLQKIYAEIFFPKFKAVADSGKMPFDFLSLIRIDLILQHKLKKLSKDIANAGNRDNSKLATVDAFGQPITMLEFIKQKRLFRSKQLNNYLKHIIEHGDAELLERMQSELTGLIKLNQHEKIPMPIKVITTQILHIKTALIRKKIKCLARIQSLTKLTDQQLTQKEVILGDTLSIIESITPNQQSTIKSFINHYDQVVLDVYYNLSLICSSKAHSYLNQENFEQAADYFEKSERLLVKLKQNEFEPDDTYMRSIIITNKAYRFAQKNMTGRSGVVLVNTTGIPKSFSQAQRIRFLEIFIENTIALKSKTQLADIEKILLNGRSNALALTKLSKKIDSILLTLSSLRGCEEPDETFPNLNEVTYEFITDQIITAKNYSAQALSRITVLKPKFFDSCSKKTLETNNKYGVVTSFNYYSDKTLFKPATNKSSKPKAKPHLRVNEITSTSQAISPVFVTWHHYSDTFFYDSTLRNCPVKPVINSTMKNKLFVTVKDDVIDTDDLRKQKFDTLNKIARKTGEQGIKLFSPSQRKPYRVSGEKFYIAFELKLKGEHGDSRIAGYMLASNDGKHVLLVGNLLTNHAGIRQILDGNQAQSLPAINS